jgi:hypothetical protein
MRHSGRWLTYRNDLYHFEAFGAAAGGRTPLWAVLRRGEMVGTMGFRERETETEFIARAMRWLDELTGASHETAAASPPDRQRSGP